MRTKPGASPHPVQFHGTKRAQRYTCRVPELRHLPGFHDPVSAITHLLGAAAFVVLGGLLLRRGRGDPARLAYLGVYAFACVFLFSMSGVYHMMAAGGNARDVMMRLDHAAIFVLIAGTFTPVHGLLFRGPLRWAPLLLVWAAAAGGIVLKTVFMNAVAEWVGLVLYLAVSWVSAVSGVLLWRRYGWAFVRPLVYGGLAYTAGAVLEFVRWPTLIPGAVHAHEVFHLAVLAGAGFHYAFVWEFAAGPVSAGPVAAAPLPAGTAPHSGHRSGVARMS